MASPIIPGLSLVESLEQQRGISVDASTMDGVAPPGWERSIKRMKKHKDISNPWALAWWMKRTGAKPAKHDEDADAEFDASMAAALQANPTGVFPAEYMAAGRGELWAQALLMRNNLPKFALR